MAVSLIDTLVKLARDNRTVGACCEQTGSLLRACLANFPYCRCTMLPQASMHAMHTRRRCHDARVQVCTTIHQPSSLITAMFDDFMLLHAGATAYYGRWADSVDYFASHGCPCPQVGCKACLPVQAQAHVAGGMPQPRACFGQPTLDLLKTAAVQRWWPDRACACIFAVRESHRLLHERAEGQG